jgi:hypothetical protein
VAVRVSTPSRSNRHARTLSGKPITASPSVWSRGLSLPHAPRLPTLLHEPLSSYELLTLLLHFKSRVPGNPCTRVARALLHPRRAYLTTPDREAISGSTTARPLTASCTCYTPGAAGKTCPRVRFSDHMLVETQSVGRRRRSRLVHRAVHALASFLLSDSRVIWPAEAHQDLIKSCWMLLLDYSSDTTSILRIE